VSAAIKWASKCIGSSLHKVLLWMSWFYRPSISIATALCRIRNISVDQKTILQCRQFLVFICTSTNNTSYLNVLLLHYISTYSLQNLVLQQIVGRAFLFHICRISCPILLTMGTAVAQWLRCCATNRKVAGSIPAGVIGIFHWHKILPIALWHWSRLSL